jgi:O-antigen/teichoic acid export membrane protein
VANIALRVSGSNSENQILKLTVIRLTSRLQSALKNEGFKKYFFNTGWMFFEKLLRFVAGIFVGAYVARYLQPAQYGLLNYVISFVAFSAFFAGLGLDTILIQELVKDREKRDKLMGTAFVMKFVASLIVFAGISVIVHFTSEDSTTKILMLIIGSGIIAQHAFGITEFYFKSKVQSKYIVISQMIALASISVLRIGLVLAKSPLPMFALTTVLDYLIAAIGLFFFYQKYTPGVFRWKFEMSTARKLFLRSWPMIFSSLAITAYMQFNQLMVKWMLGNEASGYYGVCVRLSEMWYFIPLAICTSVFPALINAKSQSDELYKDRLQRLFDLMVGISVSIALPLTLFSDFIVTLIFGEAYARSADIMTLYVWSGVFTSMGIALANWVIIEDQQKARMICLIIAGIMNIVLSYYLLQVVGLNGAAISTLISYSFANYFHLLFIPKGRTAFIALSRSINPIRWIRGVSSFYRAGI